ncbi:hypothetical protein SAMN02745165_00388 [Malonomonas rubra DSM 5091]|uniref:Uncharacterized protein n=1 Tax=Malonomonas rubra DSM 5091 TaxID=1122189 RepID=A0A1M6C345_MALRU|nr:hypothetical protein [Malonomonas rubra]SHI55373.1 hypothetical protein SAMN02745165_00388 [Malonomonas rubra DSM 5091]
MSEEINQIIPVIQRAPLPDLKQESTRPQQAPQTFQRPEQSESKTETALRTSLEKLSAGREYSDDKSFKAFTKLSRTLEKMFGDADKVDRDDGERELKQGGLRRIDTDLRKLFKGLGMPPQLAKHFSRSLTDAMRDEDVEQVNYSFTSSRSFSLEMQQEQLGYLASGDGSMAATGISSRFQIEAVQTHSLDISINLRTGEFSLNRSSSESLSISASQTSALASFTPAAEQLTEEPGQEAAVPAAETPAEGTVSAEEAAITPQNDISAIVQSDSTLLQISRTIQQSAVMQLTPASGSEDPEEATEEMFNQGVGELQQLVEQMEALREATQDLFESLAAISNLRIERNPQDGDDYLNFTLDAQAPVGLTAIDDDGRSTTIYPRDDGSLGKISEEELNISA